MKANVVDYDFIPPKGVFVGATDTFDDAGLKRLARPHVELLLLLSYAAVLTEFRVSLVIAGPIPMMIGAELFRQGPRPLAMAVAGVVNWLGTFAIAMGFESVQVCVSYFSSQYYFFIVFTTHSAANKFTIIEIFWLFSFDLTARWV